VTPALRRRSSGARRNDAPISRLPRLHVEFAFPARQAPAHRPFESSRPTGLRMGVRLLSSLLLSVLLLEAHPVAWSATDWHYRVTGTLRWKSDYSRQALLAHFRAYVRGCSWKITVFPQGRERRLGHAEMGFDGTNIYKLLYLNTNSWNIARTSRVAHLNGFITKGPVPPPGPDNIIYVWFAYASRCYVTNMFTPQLPAVLLSPSRAPESVVNAIIMHNASDSSLLDSASLLVTHDNRSGTLVPAPPPYDAGFVGLRYRSLAYTNRLGALIPTHCEYSRYARQQEGASTNDVERVWSIHLSVSDVDWSPAPEPTLPAIPGPMLVVDYRLTQAVGHGGPAVLVTDHRWPTAETPSFRETVRMYQRENRRRIFTTIMVLIVLAPGFFFLSRHFRHQDKSNKNTQWSLSEKSD